MTNVKVYEAARTALSKLEATVKAEAKVDHRLARGAKRISRLLALLKVAQGKYELVHSRKVPQKLAARKAKAKAKNGTAKKGKSADIIRLPVKKRAA